MQNAMVKVEFRAMATHLVNIFHNSFKNVPKTSPSGVSRKMMQNAAVKSDFRATATHFMNIFVLLLIFEPFPSPNYYYMVVD